METDLPIVTPRISSGPVPLRAGLKLVAVLIPVVIASGCVGGAGNYFESVSRETQQQQTAENSQSSPVSLEPVKSSALAALPDPATASAARTNDSAPAPAPLAVELEQTARGDVLLMPQDLTAQSGFAVPDTQSSILVPSGQTENNTSAYSDPQNITSSGEPLIASLDEALNPQRSNDGSGFAIGSLSTPVIDPAEYAAEQRIPFLHAQIDHGKCAQGAGPAPKKISATNIVPGDPYFIEIRMRKTPLLPVGHTYVAYGRLSADGEILDEHLIMLAPVGGYAGAALASGIPMPGILTPHRDDCRIRPETAYRVSLNAQRYEKLLMEVRAAKQEKPSYLLFAYNCNHFMSRIAKSVGLKPPKNIYVPALEYIYAMIENNEGRKVARR